MPNRRPSKQLHQMMAPLMLDHALEQVSGQIVAHRSRSGRQIDAKAVFGMRGAIQKQLAHADGRDVNGRQSSAIAGDGVFQAPGIGMGDRRGSDQQGGDDEDCSGHKSEIGTLTRLVKPFLAFLLCLLSWPARRPPYRDTYYTSILRLLEQR